MKKIRKYIAASLCVCALFLSGCDGDAPVADDPLLTAVTDAEGNPVTDDNGNMIPAVTDENGAPVTDENGNMIPAVTDENGAPVTDENGSMIPDVPEEKTVYKAGFIYNLSVNDGATAKIFENARAQIEKALDIETCYIENVLVSEIPMAVDKLKENGCNIIVSCSPRFDNSIIKEAKSSAGTYFISFGGSSNAHNLSSFGGEIYQTAGVCGIAAFYNTQSNILGVVADPSSYTACAVIDAFVLGAKEIGGVQTDVRVNWAWSKDRDKIREAIDDLKEQGADVIMCYTETDYAPEYAASLGLKVIANSCDLPELIPDNYLTGFFFNASTFLVDTMRSICADCFVSAISQGGIAAGTARLVDFSPDCREGTKDIGSRLYDYIKNGQAHIFTGEIKSRGGKIMLQKGEQLSFSAIKDIDWLAQGVLAVGDFTTVTYDLAPSELIIKE